MNDIIPLLAVFFLGVIVPVLVDILKEEIRRRRNHTYRMWEFCREAKAIINSMVNAWSIFGRRRVVGVNLEDDFLGHAQDLSSYLAYYLAYGGKREVVQEINYCVSEILQLLSKRNQKNTAHKIDEKMRKLLGLSNML